MKYILEANIINKWRSLRPLGYYGPFGHFGVDLNYFFEPIPSPVSGEVVWTACKGGSSPQQNEMGNCLYIKDKESGYIHVFAHLSELRVRKGDSIKLGDIIAISGNTGTKTTAAHLHYEIIGFKKPDYGIVSTLLSKRTLQSFVGYSYDPILYLKNLYIKYNKTIEGKDK